MLLQVTLAIADEDTRKRLRRLLRDTDAAVSVIKGTKDLWRRAAARPTDVLLIDGPGVDEALGGSPEVAGGAAGSPAVVAVTSSESPAEHAELIAAGCEAVLFSHLPDADLGAALGSILARRSALAEEALRRRPLAAPGLADFVSDSPTMREFMQVVHRVVGSQTSLLILGETGVGKERLARAIHAEGPRGGGPFVAVNCGALPEALLESELFGHEEGAFTGATRPRRGAFELAHGGTIFLDEVGDMPLHLQVKLLRVLQDHQVQRVGAEAPFGVDVRVMAASNRDLEAEVEAERFRRDLYYRLSVVVLTVPPLRDRCEDIPALARSYVQYHRPRVGRDVHGITDEAIEALCRYNWPGNVRELINVVERAMLLCKGQEIVPADLPPGIRGHSLGAQPSVGIPKRAEDVPAEWLERPLGDLRRAMVADLEHAYLAAQLKATAGRVGEAARRAGLEPRSLYDKMKRYGLAKEDFKRPPDRGKSGA